MSRIRIQVDDLRLGEVSVTIDNHITDPDTAAQRNALDNLIQDVADRVRAAYGIDTDRERIARAIDAFAETSDNPSADAYWAFGEAARIARRGDTA